VIVADVTDRALDSFAEVLPRVAGGLLLLVGGLVAAWVLGRLAARALRKVGLDAIGERFGIDDLLARIGLERSLSRLIGRAIRIALTVVVLIAAIAALGLSALSESLNDAIIFLPKLLVALAIILVGVIAADFVRSRVDAAADRMALAIPGGRAAQIAVLALFVLSALAQLGVSTQILTLVGALFLLGAVFTVALAFGLGGREIARQLTAGRYVAGSYRVGDTIAVSGVRGEIVAFEGAATVLRTDEGSTVRVPNQLLLDSIVVTEEASP
jgi:small-conductance mechanosensitive channel